MDDNESLAAFHNNEIKEDEDINFVKESSFAKSSLPMPTFEQEATMQPPAPERQLSPRGMGFSSMPGPRPLTDAERAEKSRILARLHRMSVTQKSFPIQFSVDDTLDSLRKKNTLATHTGKSKVCMEMLKRGTIFLAKGAETITTKYPNRYVDLDGYSNHLYLQIDQFDNLLYDIYDSYSEELSEVSPVLTYLFAIGSNAMMFSMTRKMLGISKQAGGMQQMHGMQPNMGMHQNMGMGMPNARQNTARPPSGKRSVHFSPTQLNKLKGAFGQSQQEEMSGPDNDSSDDDETTKTAQMSTKNTDEVESVFNVSSNEASEEDDDGEIDSDSDDETTQATTLSPIKEQSHTTNNTQDDDQETQASFVTYEEPEKQKNKKRKYRRSPRDQTPDDKKMKFDV